MIYSIYSLYSINTLYVHIISCACLSRAASPETSDLNEASEIDGAGRLRKIWNVTLPGIRPTIVVMLILNLGRILNISFDRPYAMGNFLVRNYSNAISTYVYRIGIQSQQFSLATAVGLFQSLVCVIFLVAANNISERLGERGIW